MGTVTNINRAQFSIGDIVQHKLFDYRGVIYDVDPKFQASEEWYELVARSRPPKNKPWYHVLVHGTGKTTYVAEQNLEAASDKGPITHPLVDHFFKSFDKDHYLLKRNSN